MTPDDDVIAVVGSPSTCETVTLNLLSAAYKTPLLGHMVAFAREYGDGGSELALGAVTGVETVNPAHHASSNHATHIARNRTTGTTTGDDADTRAVTVQVEAVFQHDGPEQPWRRFGTSLSNSPATGTIVTILNQQLVDELTSEADTPACLGRLRASGVHLPWTMSDFSSDRGSRHVGVLGMSGSGKTAMTAYSLACELRFESMGQIILDPQGQWSTEHGMPFSLQGLVSACGRSMTVARLSSSLRLRKDAPLLCSLLAEANWFRQLSFGAGSDAQIEAAQRVFIDALGNRDELAHEVGTPDWTEADPDTLLRYLLTTLYDVLPTGVIYAGRDGWERVQRSIRKPSPTELAAKDLDAGLADRFPNGLLDDADHDGPRWRRACGVFAALHNLWSPWTPDGLAALKAGQDPDALGAELRRRKAWGLVESVFSPEPGVPAPWLVLDLSAEVAGLGTPGDEDDSDAGEAAAETHRLLDAPEVKARIMQQILGDVLRVGQQHFAAGRALNTQITVDEAWQYAGPPDPSGPEALVALSNLFAGACRDARKLGVGFRFILQAATGLREDIWKQLAVLIVGYGLHDQADVKRLNNRVSDAHMRLYRTVPPPEATDTYTFMIVGGGATGLSFGTSPVFLEAFTNPVEWLEANQDWVVSVRQSHRNRLPADDSGGALKVMPGQPLLADPLARAHVARRRIVDKRANTAAVGAVATAATSGSASTERNQVRPGAGGARGVRNRFARPPVDDQDEPPF